MLKDYLVITDDTAEIRKIAERIIDEATINIGGTYKKLYSPLMISKMYEDIERYAPDALPEEKERLFYKFVYDFWVYGCTVDEEFYLQLITKSDEEKREYMVKQIRSVYVQHMNWEAGPDRVVKLEDKYKLYERLKPYYKRDVIEVRSMDDYQKFVAFVKKHNNFVVKPADFSCGIGVHKFSVEANNDDYHTAMEKILSEGNAIHEKHPSRVSKMVLEELIVQDESMAMLHNDSVNAIRITAVRGKDGKIHLYHPWIKVGIGGSFVATAASDGFDAEINPETGIVITNGYQENGNIYESHPDTGIQIKGFQIPKWTELKELVYVLMKEMSEYGYIGWDFVLTSDGWCVMEGNYSAEFTFQLINGRGYKKEFEELIGWKYEKDFWWEGFQRYSHN